MSEAQHLADALERLLSNPASGVFAPFITVTEGLTAAQAASVPAPRFNSIWAVVNHLWFWEESLRRVLRGESATPAELGAATEHGWPAAGSPTDEAGWQAARSRVLATNAELARYLRTLDDEAIAQPLDAWGTVRARAVLSIIAHDSYHTCEIISLRHMQGWWVEGTALT
jgi:hypothetical protein